MDKKQYNLYRRIYRITYSEYQVIKELIKYAKQVNITITIDNIEKALAPDSIFYANKITLEKLENIVKKK